MFGFFVNIVKKFVEIQGVLLARMPKLRYHSNIVLS